MTRSRWLLLFGGWTLFACVQASLLPVSLSARNAVVEFVGFSLPLAWLWAALTPAVGAWSQAIALRYTILAARIVAHVPFVIATALLQTWLTRAVMTLLGVPFRVGFDVTLYYFADLTITTYVAAVWAARLLQADAALVAQERRTLALRRELVAAQMDYLELQVRPHFLFNALSTIAELAHEAPRSAARMLQNVVALLETAVARGGRGLVTLGEELEAARPYLAIQRLRFSDWLQIEEDASADARAALVPRFILQPLIENAVHHGLTHRSAAGRIAIRATIESSRLRVVVIDNGVGLNAERYRESRGIGLANLRARLDAVYDGEATLELRPGGDAGTGTAAHLDLPLRPPNAEPVTVGAESVDVPAEPRAAAVSRWALANPALAAAAVWTLVGALRIQHSYAYMLFRDRFTPAAMAEAIRYDIAVATLWLALTPLLFVFGRRLPLRRHMLALRVVAHMAVAGGVAFVHAALTGAVVAGFRQPLLAGVAGEVFAWNVAVYAIVLAIAHHRQLDAWRREIETAADRLRHELDEARFRRVMLELRPQVLLDTLRRLVTLVSDDPRRSEKILADIGGFLRYTLDMIHDTEIPLRLESETVRAYARVLGVASVPGMTFQLSVPLSLMKARVPNGVLRIALDSVLAGGEPATAGADVRLDVVRDGDALRIKAVACAPDGRESRRSALIGGASPTREVVFT